MKTALVFAVLVAAERTRSVTALRPAFKSDRPRLRDHRQSMPPLFSSKTNPQDASVAVVDALAPPLPPLNNHYYLLRHGQSTANVAGIISSARSLAGSSKHGLTLLGVQQGREAAKSLVDLIAEDVAGAGGTGRVHFISSPFVRAKETAEMCLRGMSGNAEVAARVGSLGLEVDPDVALVNMLAERFFGRLDGRELGTYVYVWPVDMMDPTHAAFDMESVAAVARALLLDLDAREYAAAGGYHVVLTSHADVLQITQAYAAGLANVGEFLQYHFGNGEVRRMGRTVESLPETVPLQPPARGE